MTTKRAEQLILELEAVLREFKVEIVSEYNFTTDRHEKAVVAFKPLANFDGIAKFEGNGAENSNCLIVSSTSVREFKKSLTEALILLKEIKYQEEEAKIKKVVVRDRGTIEQELYNLEAVYPELPLYMDENGNRKSYRKLTPEEANLMDKAVKSQSVNMNKRRMLRAELLCITHRRAVEIIFSEESDTVYLAVENVITKNGDYTVYDIGSSVQYDEVEQMSALDWFQLKADVEDGVLYEVAR